MASPSPAASPDRQPFRLTGGGRLDRSRTLSFRFDDRQLTGHPGDTLASALLANGVHLVGRSFKYHRPRGILTAGAEEPNALVQVGRDPRTDPNVRATQLELFDGLAVASQNRWPSLEFDVGGVNNLLSRFLPAGFYYKTFMWPASAWKTYEKAIRQAAGLGVAPSKPDPDRYDKTFAHCDLLVVGAGPAGLSAALAAARAGARVVVAEQDFELGGDLLSDRGVTIDGRQALEWVAEAEAELRGHERVRILTRTICFAAYDHNFFALHERVTDHLAPAERPGGLPRHRLWKLRTRQAIFATGAIERPLVFSDNDRPGIMLASAARSYLNRWAVKPGERAVVFTGNDSGYATALDLRAAGAEVAAVVDLREAAEGPLSEQAKSAGLRILSGHAVIGTQGDKRIAKLRAARLDPDGTRVAGGGEEIPCDLLVSAAGWSPSVHLHCQAKGSIAWDDAHACFLPDASMQKGQAVTGSAAGAFGLASCLSGGESAGRAAAEALGFQAPAPRSRLQAEDHDFLPMRRLYCVPSDKPLGQGGKHFVDQQNDVTAADLLLALREGYRSIEHVKRYTTTGMGTDQGKLGNVNAIGIVAEHLGRPLPEVGVTTFRAPYTPVSFGAFAGRDIEDLLDPVRTTPMHSWHERAGALFEDVGQWRRAWYYPQEGEDPHRAVEREVRATRETVGILDATTLGKIEIVGPDAAELLNRVYTNAWSKLGIGRCRYGLMLKEDGMVMDDGVTSRLGEQRFLMTTTSGNAAAVLAHLEEWLQTEWPDLRVFLTSVTEQFATMTLSGPHARRLLSEVCDLDLANETFPHMSFQEGRVAGVPARIFRISFTGELSYEINVPAGQGLSVWQALVRHGEAYGITPYGTEAMHVLRAEKGFIIVGQETDGSVTPLDLGMDWIVSKQKDFIGRRSLSRSDMLKPDRPQLVGLLTEDPKVVLPEGGALVDRMRRETPVPMVGHVTSSYWSPNCGHSIALALVRRGRERLGETILCPLGDGTAVPCRVVEPLFFDKEGERQRA
ncbi:MAG: sarcosine oxidase subunit alpha family protein [Tistlia sp.]|uniref:sarcosine oxidase subunit alpha family protein n=1 Tax=Tistlia sp. TaxID=3057121 RepID=UPI0034A2E42F